MESLLSAGEDLEFFLEAGRSRDGKAVYPKGGLLSVIVDTYNEGRYLAVIVGSYNEGSAHVSHRARMQCSDLRSLRVTITLAVPFEESVFRQG